VLRAASISTQKQGAVMIDATGYGPPSRPKFVYKFRTSPDMATRQVPTESADCERVARKGVQAAVIR
jgi:hypothetical protein